MTALSCRSVRRFCANPLEAAQARIAAALARRRIPLVQVRRRPDATRTDVDLFGVDASFDYPLGAGSLSRTSMHRWMHSLQMETPGPATSFSTWSLRLPQNAHLCEPSTHFGFRGRLNTL
jgi:hypothetical protein